MKDPPCSAPAASSQPAVFFFHSTPAATSQPILFCSHITPATASNINTANRATPVILMLATAFCLEGRDESKRAGIRGMCRSPLLLSTSFHSLRIERRASHSAYSSNHPSDPTTAWHVHSCAKTHHLTFTRCRPRPPPHRRGRVEITTSG